MWVFDWERAFIPVMVFIWAFNFIFYLIFFKKFDVTLYEIGKCKCTPLFVLVALSIVFLSNIMTNLIKFYILNISHINIVPLGLKKALMGFI